MKKTIISVLVLAFTASCLAFSKKPEAGPVEFKTVLIGQHSLIDTSAVFMIDNSEDWEDMWKQAQGKVEPMPPVQEIDFDEYMVLAVFMGQKNTGGYSIEVSEIMRKADMLNVEVINHVSSGGMMLPVVVTPYHIVQIPRDDYELNVEYTEQRDQADGNPGER